MYSDPSGDVILFVVGDTVFDKDGLIVDRLMVNGLGKKPWSEVLKNI